MKGMRLTLVTLNDRLTVHFEADSTSEAFQIIAEFQSRYGTVAAQGKSDAYIIGYSLAETHFYSGEQIPRFQNPFQSGTDQHRGYEEGVYDFTQK